ncbi:MAG: hypothetical protein WA137_00035 [Methanothrix sp.]
MPEINGTWDCDFNHAHERMKVAVDSLVGTDSLSKRLGHALHTMGNFLGEDDFPDELKGAYRDIITECSTRESIGRETAFDVTIRRMGYRKKKEIAQRIVDLYDTIATDYILPDSLY